MKDPQIEMMPLASLTAYDKNSRTHSPEQVKQIAASLREFGFTNPVLIDSSGGIIAGHGRVMAAESMGMVVVPCLRLAHLSEAQKRAYIIADNKLAENAGWDMDILRLELGELNEIGYDLDLLGFEAVELKDLLAFLDPNGGLTDENEVPEVPAEPITKPGDVWQLGRHRIICGSCTDADVVSLVLGGAKPHLMVTDPPYGVEYDASWRTKCGLSREGIAAGKVLNDDRADWREAWALFPGDVAYVWHASTFSPEVAASLESCRFERRALIIWAKSNFVISRGHYHHMHEPCWYVVKKGATAKWNGGRKKTTLWRFVDDLLHPGEEVFVRRAEAEVIHAISGDETTVWEIDKPLKSETGHSTQKPVECMRRPIQNNSKPGDAVYEPFSGSGTTIIAAEQTGRTCYAIELNPAYVDVAVKRWENFTGQTAVLEARQ
jgi:DNA modification methylase